MFGNPVLNASTFERPAAARRTMTERGTVRKASLLVFLTTISAINALALMGLGLLPVLPVTLGAASGALFLVLATARRRHWAAVTGMFYAILEGVALGGATFAAEQASPGVALPTLVVTLLVVFGMLFLWETGRVPVTPGFKTVVLASVMGIVGTYLFSAFLWVVGLPVVWLHMNPWLNVIAPVIASACLLVDFEHIREGVEQKAPAYMEWYAALGITVTICWLYVEILGAMGDSG